MNTNASLWNPAEYDEARLAPPRDLIELCADLAGPERPSLVVDLGCGTGLSTRVWHGIAHRVIGIDPSIDMLKRARMVGPSEIEYRVGAGAATGMPSAGVNIVSCASSIHWMEPNSTLAEVKRILKPDGLLVVLSYGWPPLTGFLALDHEYFIMKARLKEAVAADYGSLGLHLAPADFLRYVVENKAFKQWREFYFNDVQHLSAGDFCGLVRSLGSVRTLLQDGISPAKFNLDKVEKLAHELIGAEPREMLFWWRVMVFRGINAARVKA